MDNAESDVASVLTAVRDIVPKLPENGLKAANLRWLPDENLALLEKARSEELLPGSSAG